MWKRIYLIQLKKLIAEHIKVAIRASYDQEVDLVEIYNSFSTPPKPELGQVAYPCFPLAKALRQVPSNDCSENCRKH